MHLTFHISNLQNIWLFSNTNENKIMGSISFDAIRKAPKWEGFAIKYAPA